MDHHSSRQHRYRIDPRGSLSPLTWRRRTIATFGICLAMLPIGVTGAGWAEAHGATSTSTSEYQTTEYQTKAHRTRPCRADRISWKRYRECAPTTTAPPTTVAPVVTTPPATAPPTTVAPVVTTPPATTIAPVVTTTPPATTIAPVVTTAPPTTAPPTTAPPTTAPPTTAPPTTAPPTTAPPTTTPPAPSGFPTAATTGVPAGTNLRASGSITITTNGAVIDGLDINGTVVVDADNVTIRRSIIRGSAYWSVRILNGSTGTVIEDVEINGRGTSGTAGSHGVFGAATVLRSNIYGVENGLTPMSGSVLRGNYIHDLRAPGSPHYDGIQIDGGIQNVVIDNNTVDMNELSQTSAVMIDNYFGPINNIAVTNNRLLGGGYTVYSDGQFSGGSITGVSFVNNRLGRGYWGYASFNGNSPVWTGNVDDITGNAVR